MAKDTDRWVVQLGGARITKAKIGSDGQIEFTRSCDAPGGLEWWGLTSNQVAAIERVLAEGTARVTQLAEGGRPAGDDPNRGGG